MKHFGSLVGDTDYSTTSHILSANLIIKPSNKIDLNLAGNYSFSKASFDPIMMPAVTDQEILETIESAYYDYSMIHNYSDLSYGFLNITAGLEYQFSPSLSFVTSLDYYDLSGYQDYVYGNESGSFYVIRTGFKLNK